MYQPKHFQETRPEFLQGLIAAHPLATLVTMTDAGLEANHIPMLLDTGPADGPHGTLRGHVARANPIRNASRLDVEALAVFQGPHSYVSPGWYPSKREHGKVVPTWNYAVVHAYGPLRFIDDAAWLRSFVARLADIHEASQAEPWKLDDAPADFTEQMVKAIVGFEIPVTRIAGKWKVSQNRPASDRQAVAEALGQKADTSSRHMAELVRERSS
jgi:transcriptional regulator